MHAAEPAGSEHADAGAHGEHRRRRDGRRAVHAAGDRGREVAHAALDDVLALGDRLERGVVEPDPHLAADHGDRRGNGAGRAHHGLDLARHLDVARAREPVGDDRALERHDRSARIERL